METNKLTLEERVMRLEAASQENSRLSVLLFELLFQVDDARKPILAEGIRKILLNATSPLAPNEQQFLQNLRDRLLATPDPELVKAMNRSPVRPVE